MQVPSNAVSLRALIAGLLVTAVGSGCAPVRSSGKSPLAPPTVGHESIGVEKYSIRFDHADPELNEGIWSEIDEECLPADLRSRLAANGFRAGVVGAHLPAAVDRLLRENPADKKLEAPPPQPHSVDPQAVFEPKPVDLLSDPKVRCSLWQARVGSPGIIVTAGEQARIPSVAVLVRDDEGHVTGRTYEKVMGVLAMKAFPERDRRVRLELIPELEYGDLRSRFVASDGVIKPDYRPETVVFKDLKLEAALSPGQMLVLGCRAEKPGSLGTHLLTEHEAGRPPEQKLLLIRLVQTPSDDRFALGEIPIAD